MRLRRPSPRKLLVSAIWLAAALALAGAGRADIVVEKAEALVEFPDRIHFSLSARSQAPLEIVELEYGLLNVSCAMEVNRALPEGFAPGSSQSLSWTWDMRRTGSLPPGSRLWWRWRLVDASGQELRTRRAELTWLDDEHPWRSEEQGALRLHWYEGEREFARSLLQAGEKAESRLAGIVATGDEPIDIYVYNSAEALRQTVLFEPGWTGGLAYADFGIVIIGIPPESLSWGQTAMAHEVAHVLVGRYLSRCYSRLPSWLSEGLAVYAEGPFDEASRQQLDGAVEADSLFSVESLSHGFAEHPQRASLSYAQSRSLVEFLIQVHGEAKLRALLEAFRHGYADDQALQMVYAFDSWGLNSAWRQWLGASPVPVRSDARQATPTVFPTFVPYQAHPAAATPQAPPRDSTAGRGVPRRYASAAAAGGLLACVCLGALGGILGIPLALILRPKRPSRPEGSSRR